MTPRIGLTLPLTAILLQACAPTPEEVATTSDVGSSTGATSAGPGPSTTPGTTNPGEDTMGTQGGTGMDTTMGAVDTTASSSTSAGETTMGVDPSTSGSTGAESSSTGEPPPPPECIVPGDCPNNETCNAMGQCESVCAVWGPNDYGYCVTPLGTFNSAVICGEALTCIVTGNPIGSAVCGRTCTSACDCPAPAGTGNATVTCGDVVSGGANECYLSCANGETCPDGMQCLTDGMGNPFFCSHPVQPIEVYGNCDIFAAGCVAGAACAVNGTHSVCTSVCPGGSAMECEAALPGAALPVACDTVIFPPDGNDCFMPCVTTPDCPAGMDCIDDAGDLLCMWP